MSKIKLTTIWNNYKAQDIVGEETSINKLELVEAFLSSQRFEMCSIWKNLLVKRGDEVILSIYRDRLL